MDNRYSHPLVSELWSPLKTYRMWFDIERATLKQQRDHGVVPVADTDALLAWLETHSVQVDMVQAIQSTEERTKHDVAAFLAFLRGWRGDDDARWIHFGLTSSDLVDTAQGLRFRAMHRAVLDALGGLISALGDRTGEDTPVLGRTHGQAAEPMQMRARGWRWLTAISYAATHLSRTTSHMAVCKLSGPVGTYAHNPPEVEIGVAQALGLRAHGPGASQIASRAPLAAWANAASALVDACAIVAHDIRLMMLLGEAELPTPTDGQVASSSMAHKRNPIREEQIEGLATMACGYASMLQQPRLWLERDISHSSVERVAVPDLWHVTMHAIHQTTQAIRDLQVTGRTPRTRDPLVSWLTLRNIEAGYSVDEARERAMHAEGLNRGQLPLEIPGTFMANYPGEPR